MKTIILAGGKGSRFSPLTDTIPKALIPIGNTTLLERVLDSLPDTVDTVIITTKYLGERIKEKIGLHYKGKNIKYAEQPQDSDGTWSALYCAKNHIGEGELFTIINCDDIFNKEELARVFETGILGMGITSTTMPAKYHGIELSPDNHIVGLKRHTETNKEQFVQDIFANGLYLLDSRVFSFIPVNLSDGELGLPQTLLANIDHYPLLAYKIEHWQPCNTFKDLNKITSLL